MSITYSPTKMETIQIGLDTPIAMLTPRQLFEMQAEWLKSQQQPRATEAHDADRWLVNSAQALAEILGTSVSTIWRMKAQGILDGAISQCGKWIVFDVNKVLELTNISNRRKKWQK